MKVKCQECNKEFNVYPSYVKRGNGKYCSRTCKDKAQSKYMKNLSKEDRPNWKGGLITKRCLNCNKEIKVKLCKKDKLSFCSKSCSASFNGKLREKKGKYIICKVCGKEKYYHESIFKRTDRNQGLFCSMKCRAIYFMGKTPKKGTTIELKVKDWLIKNNINFSEQSIIKGICVTDFFIHPNICLFVDGDYWHSLPERIIKDKEQEKMLIKDGYNFIRIKESDIREDNFNELRCLL